MSESSQSHQQLKEAYQLLKLGDRTEAARIVQAVIKEDRENLNAWWLIANILEKPDRKLAAAKRVLVLKPDHKGALIMKSELTGEPLPELTSEPQPSEFDFSKLEPIKEKKDGTAGDVQVVTFALTALAILIIAVISIAAFRFLNVEGTPEQTVESYFMALDNLNFNRATQFTCEKDHPVIRAGEEDFGLSIPGVDTSDYDLDLTELGFTIEEQGFRQATVTLTGDIILTIGDREFARYAVNDLTQDDDLVGVDPTMNLLVEDGQWVICLPEVE